MGTRIHENNWFVRRWITIVLLCGLYALLTWAVVILRDPGISSMLLTAIVATHQGYMGWATNDDKAVVDKLGIKAFAQPAQTDDPLIPPTEPTS